MKVDDAMSERLFERPLICFEPQSDDLYEGWVEWIHSN